MFVRKKINLQVDPLLAKMIRHYAEKSKMPKTQWIRYVMSYAAKAKWGGRLDPDSKAARMSLVATSWTEGEFEWVAECAKMRGMTAFPLIRRTLWTYIRKVERYIPEKRTNLHREENTIAAG